MIKKRHYTTLKGSTHQEERTIINMYGPNMRTPKYVKQILAELKADTDNNWSGRNEGCPLMPILYNIVMEVSESS